MQHPEGDPELAKQYMLKAKAEGVPVDDQGRYTGSEKLTMIATNADPGLQTATVAQGQLQQLGFKLTFRKVPQDTLYTRFCNVPASGFDICPNVGWFRDFTDPQSLLEPTFKGAAIKPQGNVNYVMLDVPGDRRRDDQGGARSRPAPSATRRGRTSTGWSSGRRRASRTRGTTRSSSPPRTSRA